MSRDNPWEDYHITLTPLGEGVEQGWTPDHSIVVFRLRNNSRAVLDIWARSVIEVMQSWSKDTPYLALHDMSQFSTYMGLTPYVHQKSTEIGLAAPTIRGRYAVIMPHSILVEIARRFLQSSMRKMQPNLQPMIGFSYAEGMAWLQQALVSPNVNE